MKRFIAGFATGSATILILIVVIGAVPTESREAENGAVVTHRLPLWEKVTWFYLRHVELERTARVVAGGETDPQRRVLKLMEWTRKTVRHIPPGLPLVDDHISHIVHRRYGNAGQLAEVFTALTTYTGNDGRWKGYSPPGTKERVYLSFVASDAGWWVFDVWNGIWFETASGDIATIKDFQRPETLRRRGHAPTAISTIPYSAYYQDLEAVFRGSFSRARGQMPWHRLLMLVGLEPPESN